MNKLQLTLTVFDGILMLYSEKVTKLGIILVANLSWRPQMSEGRNY